MNKTTTWFLNISLGILVGGSLITLPFAAYDWYKTFDPHIDETVSKYPKFSFNLYQMEATDQLPYYGCSDKNAGTGWKFIILSYYCSDFNKTWSLNMYVKNFMDENGISYSNYWNACLPNEVYSYRGKMSGSVDDQRGKIIYRIPLTAVPDKISLSIDGEDVTYSLHPRHII